MKFIVPLLFFLACPCASAQTHYTPSEINTVFRWVAAQLNVKLPEEAMPPVVLASEDIPDDIYAEQCDYCENKRINWFVPSRREIWILKGKDAGVLAHEMTHYFQVVYQGATEDNDGAMETEANYIQHQWREKHD